jgi:hypothetical protein
VTAGTARKPCRPSWLARINASRWVYLSSTRIEGRFTLRACALSHRTDRARIEAAIEIIRATAPWRFAKLGRRADPPVMGATAQPSAQTFDPAGAEPREIGVLDDHEEGLLGAPAGREERGVMWLEMAPGDGATETW